MDIVPPTADGIACAVDALRAGEVVAYPTETVYGFGVDPFNADALSRLFELKGRPVGNPVLLIVSDLEQLQSISGGLPAEAQRYADAFWPGPLSLLLPASESLPRELLGAELKVCVRWTSCAIAAQLCGAFGGAVVSTSANVSGAKPALSPGEINSVGIAVCIDGGLLSTNMPSTVFDPENGEIVREGAITREQLDSIF